MKKDIMQLIRIIDDDDIRANFKGKKLVDFIAERYDVRELKELNNSK